MQSNCSISARLFISLLLGLEYSTAMAQEDSPSKAPDPQASARLQRQRIVSDLDRQHAAAQREYGVSIEILPVLERCSPQDAPVADCRAAAAQAERELASRIEQASKARQNTSQEEASRPVNVTIIDNRTILTPDERIRREKKRERADSPPVSAQPLPAGNSPVSSSKPPVRSGGLR